MLRITTVVLVVSGFVCVAPALGNPWNNAVCYGNDCVDRLDTGLANTVFGWTDILTYTAEGLTTRDSGFPISNIAYHTPVGVSMGAASAVGRTARGLLQTASFLIPKNDFWER